MKRTIHTIILILITLPLFATDYSLLIIDSQMTEPYVTVKNHMLEELANRGYISGRNLNISQWSIANSRGMAQRAWMREKDKNHDLIFLNGTLAVQQFRDLALGNEQYKFLFGTVTDPVGLGVIEDFSNSPSRNFTGISYPVKVEERLRLIVEIFPEARHIGFIYSDMPQSISYLKWLEEALENEEFSHLQLHRRKVEFIPSERGHVRMVMLAEKHMRELNSQVDIFLSPNDQMGVQPEFVKALAKNTDKPIVGLGQKDVTEEWGALMSVFPSLEKMGYELARMAEELMNGAEVSEILPQWSQSGLAFNLKLADRYGIEIPQEYLERAENNIIR